MTIASGYQALVQQRQQQLQQQQHHSQSGDIAEWRQKCHISSLQAFCSGELKRNINQSTESADGRGCLKFFRPLELTGVYAGIKIPFGTR